MREISSLAKPIISSSRRTILRGRRFSPAVTPGISWSGRKFLVLLKRLRMTYVWERCLKRTIHFRCEQTYGFFRIYCWSFDMEPFGKDYVELGHARWWTTERPPSIQETPVYLTVAVQTRRQETKFHHATTFTRFISTHLYRTKTLHDVVCDVMGYSLRHLNEGL